MFYLGGQSGIAVGSTYAIAQSASMGGTTSGMIAAAGSMTVGAATAYAAIPAVVGGIYFVAARAYL